MYSSVYGSVLQIVWIRDIFYLCPDVQPATRDIRPSKQDKNYKKRLVNDFMKEFKLYETRQCAYMYCKSKRFKYQ